MFRERIAHWARILDLFTYATGTVAGLAREGITPLLAGTYRTTVAQAGNDPRNDMAVAKAIAYTQLSRLNH